MSLAQVLSFSNACVGQVRRNWIREEVRALFQVPFPEPIHRATGVHRQHFDPTEVQISTLLSIKTGGCPQPQPPEENCKCSFLTPLKALSCSA